eukprot:TRINITY_DN7802_c0_g3_i1.p3 TRINITY_DN7802_c0_g3~~TRINITY_DN7802_c0_g3_i1.p3  ORF type:complete len:155 (-),score=28.15 TRINITY_DN7802_c0_g3_i1:59-523(-)
MCIRDSPTPSLDAPRRRQQMRVRTLAAREKVSNSESSPGSETSTERMPVISKARQVDVRTAHQSQSRSFLAQKKSPDNLVSMVYGNVAVVERQRVMFNPALCQPASHGVYIVPRTLEFAPADLSQPVLPKQWQPGKVYRLITRYKRETFTRGYE